jgi:glycosyltransferase involved in cell wall biosynthesis
MTASTEAGPRDSDKEGPLGGGWRARALDAQREALPRGSAVVSCSAPLGVGGLGRHAGELLAALERGEGPAPASISGEGREGPLGRVLSAWPLPVSPGVRTRVSMGEFDAHAARRLPAAEHLLAFNGQAKVQFRRARRARYDSLALVSANSHMRQVQQRHALARERYPLEGSWSTHMLARNLAEYEQADRIYYATDYIRDSFLAQGFPAERLVRFPLTPDPRYAPAAGSPTAGAQGSDRFELVYVGSLHVHKGVPLLIDAIRRLPYADLRLRLVGGWGSRGMRRFVQRACAEDGRIVAGFGDPLPHLRTASLCVHPAYEDGFGYAPAEALASGVPVLVSEDTGMKALIDSPRRGRTLPTGDLDALVAAIEAAYRGEILAG